MTQPNYHDPAILLYDYIASFMMANQYPPKKADMMAQAKITETTLTAWLGYLMAIGKVRKMGRGIFIVAGIEYMDKREWQTEIKH